MVRHPNETLSQFLGAWFPQDWRLEADDWPQVVDDFTAIASDPEIQDVASGLRRFLREIRSDALLEGKLFDDFGCCYDPRPEAPVRAWLGRVVLALEEQPG